MKIPINFELDTGDSFEDEVWDRAADRLVNEVSRQVRVKITEEFPQVVKDVVETRLREKVNEIIENGWEETASWGEATGKKCSLTTLVNGALTRKERTGSYDEPKYSFVENLIKQCIKENFDKAFKEEIQKAREVFRAQVDELAKQKLRIVLAESLGLKP